MHGTLLRASSTYYVGITECWGKGVYALTRPIIEKRNEKD